MEKDWLNSLREKMDGFGETVPDSLWEGVEASLEKSGKTVKKPSRRAFILPWPVRIAAAAVVVFGAVASLFLYDSQPSPQKQDSYASSSGPDAYVSDVEDELLIPGAAPENLLADASPLSGISAGPVSGHSVPGVGTALNGKEARNGGGYPISGPVSAQTEEYVPAVPSGPDVTDARILENDAVAAGTPEETAENQKNVDYDNFTDTVHFSEDWPEDLFEEEERRVRPQAGKPSLKLSVAGSSKGVSGSSTFNARQFYRSLGQTSFGGSPQPGEGDDGIFILASPLSPMLSSSDVETATKHSEPVRVGLSLRLPLWGRLGLESGLAYSKLSSTYSTVSGNHVRENRQELGYLGLPVNLTFDFVRLRWLTVYASGGAMVEKSIYAKLRSSEFAGGEQVGAVSTEKLDAPRPLQWSFNAAAGFQLNLAGSIGVYAEPTLSYRLPAKSPLKSVYTERPSDFLFSFGIRYSFE